MPPPQAMEPAHYWYYMLELGFYGSLLLRISVDIKRKVNIHSFSHKSNTTFAAKLTVILQSVGFSCRHFCFDEKLQVVAVTY